MCCVEYLVARVQELQKTKLPMDSASSSAMLTELIPLPLPPSTTTSTTAPTLEYQRLLENIRERFRQVVGVAIPMRAASAPALILPGALEAGIVSDGISSVPERADLFSPQPVRAGSVQFNLPFLPEHRTSSPYTPGDSPHHQHQNQNQNPHQSQSSSGDHKKRHRKTPQAMESLEHGASSHYNLPWTEDEKRRLVELLEIYPEEEIQARRYAKIAAAIGTRTASQVANRINKLSMKRKRRLAQGILEPDAEIIDESRLAPSAKASADFQEYQRLKKILETVEENPNITIHHGFRCDVCEIEPIVGVRWRCSKCREPNAVDLCEECYEDAAGHLRTATHKPDHKFMKHK